MEPQEVLIRAPYSVILVDGGAKAVLPREMAGLVAATADSVAVGTRPEADGPTVVRVGGQTGGQAPLHILAFEGAIATPSLTVFLRSVEGDVYLRFPTLGATTRLRIYVDHDSEPTEINVAVAD